MLCVTIICINSTSDLICVVTQKDLLLSKKNFHVGQFTIKHPRQPESQHTVAPCAETLADKDAVEMLVSLKVNQLFDSQ